MLKTPVKNGHPKIIFDLLRQHGSHALAYHTLQSNLNHFILEDGYLAYYPLKKGALVLGDPVCEQSKAHLILGEFIRRQRNVAFVQLSKTTASILSGWAFNVFQMGLETMIRMPFSLKGKEKADLRNLYNSSVKKNVSVKEINNRSEIVAHFSTSSKYCKEFSFLARRLENHDEKDVRIFGGYHRGELKYISLFDPIYKLGKIDSYAEVISRRKDDAPKGVRVHVLLEAMKTFHKEGRTSVNLGLSPLYRGCQISGTDYHDRFMDLLLAMVFEHGHFLYNFKGLAFHKSRFKGEEFPVYFASRAKFPLLHLLKTYLVTTRGTATRYTA